MCRSKPQTAPAPPFTIGQQVYLREGTNTGYGCEPVTVVGLEWRNGYSGHDYWRVNVGEWSERRGLHNYSGYLDPDDLVATVDEIDPQYRDVEADDGVPF